MDNNTMSAIEVLIVAVLPLLLSLVYVLAELRRLKKGVALLMQVGMRTEDWKVATNSHLVRQEGLIVGLQCRLEVVESKIAMLSEGNQRATDARVAAVRDEVDRRHELLVRARNLIAASGRSEVADALLTEIDAVIRDWET